AFDVRRILTPSGSVLAPQQGEGRHASVGDIRRVGDIRPLDPAALVVGAPTAALAPAAVAVLLADQVGEPLVDCIAERFPIHALLSGYMVGSPRKNLETGDALYLWHATLYRFAKR